MGLLLVANPELFITEYLVRNTMEYLIAYNRSPEENKTYQHRDLLGLCQSAGQAFDRGQGEKKKQAIYQ